MISDVKRWMVDTWHFHAKAPDLPTSSPVCVVLASDYDTVVAAHEMTAHELKCAEAELAK